MKCPSLSSRDEMSEIGAQPIVVVRSVGRPRSARDGWKHWRCALVGRWKVLLIGVMISLIATTGSQAYHDALLLDQRQQSTATINQGAEGDDTRGAKRLEDVTNGDKPVPNHSIWDDATKIVHSGVPIVDSEQKNLSEIAKQTERNDVRDDTFGEGKTDCRTQRERAMLKLEYNPENGNYIPTCTGENDILFDRTQCHRLSHICWCVNPESGIPLSGTSKYNAKPNCNGKNSTISGNVSEIKGCLSRKKSKFYQRLFSSLISEWIIALGDDASDDAFISKDKAVRWKFEQLDANNNSILERKEWKPYRSQLRLFNKVRKCGRNFMRFCDANSDRKITLDEWLDCTVNVNTMVTRSRPLKAKLTPSRKNPFLDILRPDD